MGTKARNSNIELLRIITICGVVVLHYNGGVAFNLVTPGSVNAYALLLLEALFIGGVNLFVLTSGYFLCSTQQRRAVKVLELVVQVMVMGALRYVILVLLGDMSFTPKGLFGYIIPNNYFMSLYLGLYLISPYINLAISKLTDKQLGIMLAVLGVLFSLWPTVLDTIYFITDNHYNGLYPTNSAGSQYGYSLLNFILMYLLGGYLRRVGAGKRSTNGIGILVCISLLLLWQLWHPTVARAYCNPLVILLAVFVFRLFLSVQFQSKAINVLAKGAFTCFLLHQAFLGHIGIEKAVNKALPLLLAHVAVSAIGIFLLCWLAWRVYEWITRPVFRLTERIFEKPLEILDKCLSPTEKEESV